MTRFWFAFVGAVLALAGAVPAAAQWSGRYGPYGPFPYPPPGAEPAPGEVDRGYDRPYRDPRWNDDRAEPRYPPAAQGQRDLGRYHAVGTEPGWSLDLDSRWMIFSGAYGENPLAEPTPRAIVGFAGELYRGERIDLNIVHRRCSDGMSDRVYPDTVQLTVDGVRYRGCGGEAASEDVPPLPEPAAEPTPAPKEPAAVEPVVAKPKLVAPKVVEAPPAPKPVVEVPRIAPVPIPKLAEATPVKPIRHVPAAPRPAPLRLAGSRWRVVAIAGRAVPATAAYRVEFDQTELHAQFGCKKFKASFRQAGDRVTPGGLLATQTRCAGAAARFEAQGAAILGQPMQARTNPAGQAELAGDAGVIRLERIARSG